MYLETGKLINQTLRIRQAIAMGGGQHPLDGVSYARPVDVDFLLTSKEREFKLEGSFGTTLFLTCHRCLSVFRYPIEQEIDLVFIPRDQMPTQQVDVELADADMNIASYADGIDLCQVINEQVVLALPMKILCSEQCKGLCPHCGADLGDGDCGCSRKPADERLLVLADIKEKLFGDAAKKENKSGKV